MMAQTVNVLKWTEKAQGTSTLHKELDITEKKWEQERRSFSRTMNTNLLSSAQWSSPENIHTIIRWIEQVTLRNTHVCTYVNIRALTIREKGGY